MGFGEGFNKQYPGLENSGSTDIKVTGSLLVTGNLTVLGSSIIGAAGGDAYIGSTNIFTANQIISGNLDIDGTITAKRFNVITSSVLYESGSTKFGDTSNDTHQFTGSVISSVGFTGSLMGDVGEFTIDRNINHNSIGSLNTFSSSSPNSDIYGNVLLGYNNQITSSDDTFGNIILAFGTRMNSQGSTYGNIILQEVNTFAADAFQGNMFNAWNSSFSGSSWYSNYFGGDLHNISGASSFRANHIFGSEADIKVDDGFYYNAIFGKQNKLTGSYKIQSSVVHGDSNSIYSTGSDISNNAILGTQNSSSHTSIVLLGSGLVSTNANQAIAGQYNATSSTYQFAIGNGIDGDNRSNVLEVSASTVTVNGTISASFSGNGSNLTDLPSVSINHVIFVTKGGDDTTGSGSITKPFLTVQEAINYASSSYPDFSEGVQIEIAPGLYTENVTLTRHNTYIVSSLKKAEQRSVTIKGNFTINCTAAAQKFNHVVGLEGIFFNNFEDATSPTLLLTGSATSGHLTYLKGCYIAQNSSNSNANAFKTSGLRFSDNFSGSKITAQNTTFLAQKAGADVVSLDGGDYKFDSCEVYCNIAGSSNDGIKITGQAGIQMDRMLVEVYTNGYAVNNASTKTTDTPLAITNSSLASTGATSLGIVNSSTNAMLWNIIFTGNATYTNYKIKGTAGKLAYFSQLTAPVTMSSTGITLVPLTETHGTIVAASITSSLGFSGSLSSSYLVGTIPVSKGGTGATTFSGNSLLIASGSNAFTSLTGSAAADKYVVTWNATGSNFVLTASAGGGGLASVLTSGSITGSGITENEVRLKDDISSNTFTASVGFSGSLFGQATSALTASYVNALTQSVYILGNLSVSSGITGSFKGDGSQLSGVSTSVFNGQILVNSGGTGLTSVPSGALLLGSSSTALSTLSGTADTVGYVATWNAGGFTLKQTGSGLPSSGDGQGHVLIVSGTEYKWVAIEPSSSVDNKPFTFLHSSGGIQMSQSSAISINSGGLGQITRISGALYVLNTEVSKFVPVTGTTNQFIAWDGNKWAATDGFSRQVYTTATPSLAAKQIVALSGGLVAATAADRLKANAFGVIQTSGSSGYIVQTSGEVLVAFLTSNPTLLVTGSELYVSSSGTASLYEDISGNPNGVYATQIGYLNRIVGSDYYVIISPRPFGLVY